MDYIIVAVSPFYNGRGWTDQATGLSFEPTSTIRQIRIKKEGRNLSGIKNSVRLNNLMLLEGNLDEVAEDQAPVNPEELTSKEFNRMLDFMQGKSVNEDDKALAEKDKEIKALKEEVSQLKALLEAQADAPAEEAPEEEESREDELSAMTVAELKAYADEQDIEIKSSDNKKTIIGKIITAEA